MFKHLFRLDLRSLALARVLLGLLAIYDIGRRIPEIEAFFSDDGIMSRADVIHNAEITWRMTLLNLNGSYEYALLVAIIGLLASITFTLGWKTRISNLVIWLVIISFQARFPEIATSGGDMLLRIFFFWSLFLPMSAVYSFDHAVTGGDRKEKEYFSVFTSIWIMQVFALYFFTFIYKWAPVYHTDFNAVWYMLQLELYTTPFGQWMGKQYMLTKVLSALSYLLELVGPLMLLIPWKRDMWRGAAVLAFFGFHLGIGATMYLGNFVPICLIIWVALIPTSWWNYLAGKIKNDSGKLLTLYHDSESNFARQLGLITKEMFFIKSMNVCAFPLKKQGLINDSELFILENKENKNYAKGLELVSLLLKNSTFSPFRKIGKVLSSDFSSFLNEAREVGGVSISDSVEGTTERKKSKLLGFMKTLFEFFGFDQVKYRLNKFEKMMGSLLLVLVLGWNVEGVIEDRDWYIGSPFDEIMFTFQLNQGWAMFAPHPQRSDGWWVMEGTLKNGEKWDALNNKEVTYERPNSFYKTFPTENWRNLLDGLQGREEVYIESLGRYLCRRWNSKNSGDQSLQTFKLYYMEEWTNGPQEKPSPVEKRTIWNHNCF